MIISIRDILNVNNLVAFADYGIYFINDHILDQLVINFKKVISKDIVGIKDGK